MKLNFFLILSFIFLGSTAKATVLDSIQDTVPFDNPEYIGYRMAITDLTVSPMKSGKTLKVKYKIINTGREDLLFGKKISPPPYLVVNFDHSLSSSGLFDYAMEIKEAVIQSDFSLSAGTISKNMIMNIPITVDKQIKLPEQEENLLTDDLLVAKGVIGTNTEKRKENTEESTTPMVDENACSDLIIESIRVVRKSKKSVTLEYTIVNRGARPAPMIKNPKKEENNMALKAHFSTKDRLTKGSLPIGGAYLKNGLFETKGKLYPGEKFKNTIKLNIQKMTDFTPYIILELDPYMAVNECDKTNNKGAVKVGKGRTDN